MPQDKAIEITPERANEIFGVTQKVFNVLVQSGLSPAEATVALGMTAKAVVMSALPQSSVPEEIAVENAKQALLEGFSQEFENPAMNRH